MATYCYRCKNCKDTFVVPTYGLEAQPCPSCGTDSVIRDYAAEGVGVGSGVRESRRELSKSGYADLFLPSNEDFASPSDPDGTKGMREWRDKHKPRDGNTKPYYPGEVEKKVLSGYGGKGTDK